MSAFRKLPTTTPSHRPISLSLLLLSVAFRLDRSSRTVSAPSLNNSIRASGSRVMQMHPHFAASAALTSFVESPTMIAASTFAPVRATAATKRSGCGFGRAMLSGVMTTSNEDSRDTVWSKRMAKRSLLFVTHASVKPSVRRPSKTRRALGMTRDRSSPKSA